MSGTLFFMDNEERDETHRQQIGSDTPRFNLTRPLSLVVQ